MNALLELAKEEHIQIDLFPMNSVKACSIPNSIALNPNKIKTSREFKECLAHELGHQATGSFYKLNSKFETRLRMEERSTRWAVQKLIPAEDLKIALKNGYTEVWQLAEYFDVPENFIRDTIRIHKLKGNL